jgi:uncharacterized protein involved in type VI secretion and phage assembly
MINDFQPDGGGPRYFGFYPAIVTDLVDPDGLGRIEVKLPWLGEGQGAEVRGWATLLTPYAGDNQGFEFLPEVDTQVVVGFEAGNPRRPYIVGACWNGKEKLPEAPAAPNNKRLIRTRSQSLLEFDDTAGAAKITISMASGHQVVLDDAAQTITIQHSAGPQILLTAAGQIQITASASVEITSGQLNVHAPVANFDGLVTCTTLIASATISSPTYVPAAGNMW